MTNRRFLFLLSSARSGGNTESMARAAAAALPPDATQDWCDLTTDALPAFEDLRHGASYGRLSAPMADLAERTMQASDLVFVAPCTGMAYPPPPNFTSTIGRIGCACLTWASNPVWRANALG
jgi:NAD(P)H-dependent FMN reductase